MTFKLDECTKDGVTYLDTPGLADITKRQLAATAITEALKKNGRYRVFFILTLEQGRLRSDDVSLISLVLDSAPDIKAYSLILNQVNKAVRRMLSDETEIYRELLKGGISEHQLPKRVHIVDRDDDIDGEKDETLRHPDSFLQFVEDAIPVNIDSSNVNEIRYENYDELRKELDRKVQEFKEKEELMQKHFDDATYGLKLKMGL